MQFHISSFVGDALGSYRGKRCWPNVAHVLALMRRCQIRHCLDRGCSSMALRQSTQAFPLLRTQG